MNIEKEVKFIIECHEKIKENDDLFKTRLKELFLTGEISKEAYTIASIMYPDLEKKVKPVITKKESTKEDPDPCGIIARNRSSNVSRAC